MLKTSHMRDLCTLLVKYHFQAFLFVFWLEVMEEFADSFRRHYFSKFFDNLRGH